MIKTLSHRLAYLSAFIFVTLIFAVAAYLEFYLGIAPCPLCILQRFSLAALGCVFLIGALFSLKNAGNKCLGFLTILFSFTGLILSSRQTWLQHNPLGLTSNCDVSFSYMVQALPLTDVITRIFEGGTECSQVNWQFLTLSLAEWSSLWFGIFLLFGAWQFFRRKV